MWMLLILFEKIVVNGRAGALLFLTNGIAHPTERRAPRSGTTSL